MSIGEKDVSATPISSCAWMRGDWGAPTTEREATRQAHLESCPQAPGGSTSASAIRGSRIVALDYQRLQHADLRILADTSIAIPMLTELLKARRKKDGRVRGRYQVPAPPRSLKRAKRSARWAKDAREDWDASRSCCRGSPAEVWDAIKGETGCSPPTRSRNGRACSGISTSLPASRTVAGTATQFGISPRRGARAPRQEAPRRRHPADGDLMFDAGAIVGRGEAPHPPPSSSCTTTAA